MWIYVYIYNTATRAAFSTRKEGSSQGCVLAAALEGFCNEESQIQYQETERQLDIRMYIYICIYAAPPPAPRSRLENKVNHVYVRMIILYRHSYRYKSR